MDSKNRITPSSPASADSPNTAHRFDRPRAFLARYRTHASPIAPITASGPVGSDGRVALMSLLFRGDGAAGHFIKNLFEGLSPVRNIFTGR